MTSVVTSVVVLGQLFGAFFAGRISNTIGRKRSLVLVALGYTTFAGLQGLAPNEWFLTANFIVGVVFLNALGALGGAVTFGIFFALALISFAFVFVLAPETKGRPLEEIRTYWYNGGRWPQETST